MTDWTKHIDVSFGAKYVAEDTASYILYAFDRSVLDGRALPVEKFARYLGITPMCEYVTGDCTSSLGVAAFEPQRLYLRDGTMDIPFAAAVAERDIIDRGEDGLYRFALAIMCAEWLFYGAKHGFECGGQLSFGLDTVPSENKKEIRVPRALEEAFDDKESAANFALKLFLPKNGFKRQAVEIYASLGVNRATVTEAHLPLVLSALSRQYEAPEIAVLARLRELHLYG